jgi:hypothetical protein
MLKKTLTYTNYNDVEVTRDFYFFIEKVEAIEMLGPGGDTTVKRFKAVTEARPIDPKAIVGAFKEIVSAAYGERSEDGELFEKSPEITRKFMSSAAMNALIIDLLENPNQTSTFINGIFPAALIKEAEEAAAKAKDIRVVEGVLIDDIPPNLSLNDLATMTPADLNPAKTVHVTIPKGYAAGIDPVVLAKTLGENPVEVPWANRAPTKEEVRGMTREQLQEHFLRMNAES